ncbi:MAG: RIP metalloprotease RseP [Acetobacteraceae bacterium]|nr:RIP metalloprotease RseP [Acetobacteraceae bacterium]
MSLWVPILALGAIILFHELGHFLAARAVGVRVEEFAIGYGPTLARFRRGATVYSLRLLLPLGGFVRLAGLDPASAGALDAASFPHKTVGQRTGVIAAGSVMNFLLAVLLFTVVYAGLGITRPGLRIEQVLEGYPAAQAGIQPGDRVVEVDGRRLRDWLDLQLTIQRRPGQDLVLGVDRGGRRLEFRLRPVATPEGQGLIGVVPAYEVQRFGVLNSLGRGFRDTLTFTWMWLKGLVQILTGRAAGEVTGPVGIIQLIGQAARVGLSQVLFLLGLISTNLALLNLLPVPGLDGSRLVFLAIERVRGRPIDPRHENLVHFLGFALLMLLVVVLTYRDLARILEG